MASLSTPSARPQQPAKQMSSRLLNMKFMKRAAAASPTSTPTAATTQTPSSEPFAKRRRIENTASSPSASNPATPSRGSGTPTLTAETQSTSLTLPREGISTFSRGDGADTEWVLDLKIPFSNGPSSSSHSLAKPQASGVNGSRFSSLHEEEQNPNDDSEDGPEDEDIWTNQPVGRQTYGSFKQKRKTGTVQKKNEDDNGDLSSGSENPDAESDSDGSDHHATHRRTPSRLNKKKFSNDADSDEEMRLVRRAIEQKHRTMLGTATAAHGGGGIGGRGQKRGREDGNYKSRKKLRQTI
ncbi:hypothetical protein A1O3_00448 [Capronia epimyces CBS 606.96]|uniref:Uncharacterized protein n=1 Tax=Capronia epimyces CBS 606.96 TaxID=1182542 RepID=W9YH95_9EURO|nr:uncharacterized protein A1O3_00448 [Capronia epimyces CBS 606.96]EXJ91898.1 hypothetical protein A1O3_00448 [Capronia epimyces CBS 606.96]